VACSGPSNITLCCRVTTPCYSLVAVSSGPVPCATVSVFVTDTHPPRVQTLTRIDTERFATIRYSCQADTVLLLSYP